LRIDLIEIEINVWRPNTRGRENPRDLTHTSFIDFRDHNLREAIRNTQNDWRREHPVKKGFRAFQRDIARVYCTFASMQIMVLALTLHESPIQLDMRIATFNRRSRPSLSARHRVIAGKRRLFEQIEAIKINQLRSVGGSGWLLLPTRNRVIFEFFVIY
jgi:hypothetical protein